MPLHRLAFLIVIAWIAGFGLTGCLTLPTLGASETTAAPSAGTDAGTAGTAGTRARATGAASAALGGKAVADVDGYVLCSLVDKYKMCGNRPCRKDGLVQTTYLVCHPGRCRGSEVSATDGKAFKSLPSCVSACRSAERAARAKKNRSETFYCSH